MTLTLTPAARQSASAEILAKITDDGCNLAVWERPAPAGIDTLDLGTLEPLRFAAPLSEFEARLDSRCQGAGYTPATARTALVRDVANLADHYAAIMQLDKVQVRLEVVTTDSCRKFHADYVKARLITTYIGTGTQWIEGADVARIAKGAEPSRINTLEPGDVGLFKGKMWSENPAIHRSPPIEGTNAMRLLLVLDPAQEAGGLPDRRG